MADAATPGSRLDLCPGQHWLFAYGLLRDPATLQRLLGRVPPNGGEAWLPGYARLANAEGYYYLVPNATAALVDGLLWLVTDADIARLDAFEEVDPADPAGPGGEYRRVAGRAETNTGAVACWVYVGGAIAGSQCVE